MPFHIRDAKTDAVVRKLAEKAGLSMTDAVRMAATEKLEQLERAESAMDKRPFLERIKDIQDRLAAYPETGLKADKAFFDELSGDE